MKPYYENDNGVLYHGPCLDIMPELPDKSIDMVLCDLPYGTTACKWDVIIPFEPLWAQYRRLIKDNGAIVLTASQPFTSALVMSNPKMFKYCWVWEKNAPVGFLNARRMPLKNHEERQRKAGHTGQSETLTITRKNVISRGQCRGSSASLTSRYTQPKSQWP